MARIVLVVAFMAMFFVSLSLGANAADCLCSCCLGNYCAELGELEYVGTVTVGSCGSCNPQACYNNFPSSCPDSSAQSSGSVRTSCSDSGDSSTGDQVEWEGVYDASNSLCDQSACCCVTGTVNVIQDGLRLTGDAEVSGVCQGQTMIGFQTTLSSYTTTQFDVTVMDNHLRITKTKDGITIINEDYLSCSGSAVCVSGPACETQLSTAAIVGIVAGCLVFVLLVVIIVLVIKRSRPVAAAPPASVGAAYDDRRPLVQPQATYGVIPSA